ncbi:MAG: M81 family metallopeptidase [Gemmataceae bacterium]|nr:M81 family metallopeptidase [Gemmataceae bacterium]
MRIAIGQLWQETNTLNPLPTTRADFEPLGIYFGDELLTKLADVNEPGGFIQSVRQWPENPELAGLARFAAWPSGPVTPDTIAELLTSILDRLRTALPVDAVYLALHGAMVAEGMPDVEGELLRQVRALVGPRMPVVASLDLHTNVTRQMVEQASALVLYHTAPHIDVCETGQRAAAALRHILIDRAVVVTAFQKLPLVAPAERANTQDPASVSFKFRECLQRAEADPDILCAGLATVQPWLEIPELGSAVIVTSTYAPKALRLCRDLAEQLWQQRRGYLPELTDLPDAVRLAHAEPDGLVVLGDAADSTNSGSTGECTAIVSELTRYDWPRPALTTMVAPYAVEEAQRQGVGARYTADLGGVRDRRFSTPIRLDVEVANLFDARFTLTGHIGKNMPIDMGPAAVLKHGNVHLLVTTRSGPHFAPDFFRTAGLDPFAAQVLTAKSPCGFRAAYQDHAKKIYMVRSPGCAPSDFWNHPYLNIPRPLWPWDEIDAWAPEPVLIA